MTDLQEKAMRLALDVLGDVETSGWTTKAAAREVMQALRQALAQPEHEPVSYKEECWACGCEDCICATKVPGYTKQIIEAAPTKAKEKT